MAKKRRNRIKELIDFAEERVGKECIVKEDSVLHIKRSEEMLKSKNPREIWEST